MKSDIALEQLKTIHEQLSKTSVYSGYKPIILCSIGVISLLLGFLQYRFWGYVNYIYPWLIMGCVIPTLLFVKMFIDYMGTSSSVERSKIKNVFLQFFPGLLTCILIFYIFHFHIGLTNIIPGLWTINFGLILVSLSQLFNRNIRVMGYYYLLGGVAILYLSNGEPQLFLTAFSIVFALGHFITAFILKRSQRVK